MPLNQTPQATSPPIVSISQAFQYSGKLLLRQEIPLNDIEFNQALEGGLFSPLSPFIGQLGQQQCRRCGNHKKSLLGMLPCSSCGYDHIYCRKCIEMGRVMACENLYTWTGPIPQWTCHQAPCTWEGELTAAQRMAADSIVQAISKQERKRLVWAVCGAGKTEMLFSGITEALRHGKRLCVATPRADVVQELKPRLNKAFHHVTIEALYGDSPDKTASAQLMIATTHQLIRFQHAFDLLIIDEIDAFPYHADPSLPFAANRAVKTTGTTIYLTATPLEKDKQLISRNKLPHVFVPVRYHGHPLPVPRMKMCGSLRKDVQSSLPPADFMTWLRLRANPERQLLIFVPVIALAEVYAEHLPPVLLREAFIKRPDQLAAVHAGDMDRTMKVTQFRQQELRVIVTTTILERGVTFPSVDVAVLDASHRVFDEAALVQIAGRAGRSADDPTGEVVFFHDGKTEAMVAAIKQIQMMNKRGGF